MIKYVLSKTIKHRRYEHTLFAGTNLDQTITLPKGTYVEFIPVAYLDLFGNVNDCKNCSLTAEATTKEEEEQICDFCYENYTAQDLVAIFVEKDANMCFEDSGEHTPDVSCSSNAKIIHKERLHYTEIPSLVKTYKLKLKVIKDKVA